MKLILQLSLYLQAAISFAQTLDFPPRATNAPGGTAFANEIKILPLEQREQRVLREILAGNVPAFLRHLKPVSVTNMLDGTTNVASIFVTPDYLAVGSDEDYLLMPMSPNTAQRIADRTGCVLPTRKMVDAIYAAAEVKLPPLPIPPSPAMTTVPVFVIHDAMVRTQRLGFLGSFPLGALVAGDKKDVVISPRLTGLTNKQAIYGWHQTKGAPIQPLFVGHSSSWVDYSQGIRLVQSELVLNGKTTSVARVLADPKLCGLFSDEGAITNDAYPTNSLSAPAAPKLDLPWPHKFRATGLFDEWICDIETSDDVRIEINAPAPDSFSSDKPVLLIFYALPNGNSIEETAGKAAKPGDDWHFDIQHIGAQTRFLRAVLTNRTIVVAYLEAASRSWPIWRKSYDNPAVSSLFTSVQAVFAAHKVEVALACHSGGGSLIFGYLETFTRIPDDVVRIAFLDSDYTYKTVPDAERLSSWLQDSENHRLCVLAYQDSVALLNGKTFVSEQGGTWGRSRAMLNDLREQFTFVARTNNDLETFSALDGRVQFLLKEDPERKILHTVQVERNGFIEAILSGTTNENKGYEYLGPRSYSKWIQHSQPDPGMR